MYTYISVCVRSLPGALQSYRHQLQHVRPNPLSSSTFKSRNSLSQVPPIVPQLLHIYLLYPPRRARVLSLPRALNPQSPQTPYTTQDGRTHSNLGGKMNTHANAEIPLSSTSQYLKLEQHVHSKGCDRCTYPVSKQPNPLISPAFKYRISLASFAQHPNFSTHLQLCITVARTHIA